jgi:hypothetical protein
MNWDMITAIAVVIGMVAVTLSLLYLAQQMKEATRQRRLESHQTILGDVDDFTKLVARDHANADVWWRASKGLGNLTDAERVRYFAMLFILFRSWERAFHYRSEGELEAWSADVIMKPMTDFTMSNGVQEYWALRKRWYTADFRDWIDKQMRERSGVDVYGDDFRIFGSVDVEDSSTLG